MPHDDKQRLDNITVNQLKQIIKHWNHLDIYSGERDELERLQEHTTFSKTEREFVDQIATRVPWWIVSGR